MDIKAQKKNDIYKTKQFGQIMRQIFNLIIYPVPSIFRVELFQRRQDVRRQPHGRLHDVVGGLREVRIVDRTFRTRQSFAGLSLD